MLGNAHFYNRTIRKVVVAFGSMFNDILLTRYSKDGLTAYEVTKVPLSYGAKEKFVVRLQSDPNLTKSIQTTLPRMSFELSGMTYDSSRKQQSTLQNFGFSSGSFRTQFTPVPYNFDFSLSLYVRNTEDGTQILEQILPFFTPDFTVTIDFIKEMDQKYDMPVILNSVSSEIDYEGDFLTTRFILWNLTFTAKAYIWPPVSANNASKQILQANANIFTDSTSLDAQKVFVNMNTGFGVYTTGEDVRVEKRGVTGKVLYFSNTADGTLVLTELNKKVKANDKVTGVYSNSTFTISTVSQEETRVLAIVVTPKPANANSNGVYGYEETFTEWPNTLI